MKRLLFLTILQIVGFANCLYATTLVGKVQGTMGVNAHGAATYTIPLNLHDGISSFTPQLALSYNSQGGNGLLGYGWSLSGLSSITIGPRNVYFDTVAEQIYQGSDNAYYLDGMRLLLVEGTDGQVGAKYRTESDEYNIIQIETVLGDTPGSFFVKRTDGTVFHYGSSSGRLNYSATEAYGWALDYAIDRLGNYIQYNYSTDGLTLYITSITYGKNINNIYSIECNVSFTYSSSRGDAIHTHLFETSASTRKRLQSIICKYNNAIYRTYELSYDEATYSHLVSVQEKGIGTDSYPITTFTWNNLPTTNIGTAPVSVTSITGIPISDQYYFSGDIDNDGQSELICLYNTEVGGSNSTSPYINASILKKDGTTGAFSNITHLTPTQNGVSVRGVLENLVQGGVVAHVNYSDANSLVMPYYSANDANMCFYFFKEGVKMNYPLVTSGSTPCYTITDIDNDGLDEFVVLENSLSSGRYPYGILSPIPSTSTLLYTNSSFNLPSAPSRITSADFNSDGMTDLLICTSSGYYIYWNQTGQFSDDYRTHGNEFGNCDILELGDFNGDGLPDLVVNKHNSSDWYLAINQGTTSSSMFSFQHIYILEQNNIKNDASTTNDDDKFYCIVQDFDYDGKSDLFVGSGIYSNNNFQGLIFQLKSTGTSFTDLGTALYSNASTFPTLGKIALGDFDGNSYPEIVFYGGDAWNNNTNASAWYCLTTGTFSPACNKITAINDGMLTHTISYDVLTNENVYESSPTASFPILNLKVPLPVATMVTSSDGVSSVSTSYTYKNALYHWQGKGFLGFKEITETASSGITTTTSSNLNQTYFVLYPKEKKKYNVQDIEIGEETYTYAFDSIGYRRYYLQNLGTRTEDILNGFMTDEHISGYNQGQPSCYETNDNNNFQDEKNITYWICPDQNKLILGLPSSIETTKSEENGYSQVNTSISYVRNGTNGLPLNKTETREGLVVNRETYQYNSCGQLLRKASRAYNSTDSLVTTYTYDLYGRLSSITDPMGLTKSFSYNSYGNVYQETDPYGTVSTYTYDAMQRCTSKASPIHQENETYGSGGYGGSRYKITSTSYDHPTQTIYYDGFGRKVAEAQTRFDGRKLYTDYSYLPNGELGFVSFPHISNSVSTEGTAYTYDINNRLVSTIDTNGKTTAYSYGEYVIESTIDGVTTSTEYLTLGLPGTVEDDTGYVDYEYNADGKPVRIGHNGLQTNLTYDQYGRLSSSTDMNGVSRSFTYDRNGYLYNSIQDTSRVTFYNDKYGRIETKLYKDKDYPDTLAKYTYNALQQLVMERSSTHCYTYTYDAYGRLSTESRTIYGPNTENMTCTYSYNSTGNLSQKSTTLGNTGITAIEKYTYNNGWCTEITLNDSLVWKLTGEDGHGYPGTTRDHLNTTTWQYDVYGNLISESVSGHDTLSLGYRYDSSGNMIRRNGMTLSYDDMNRLTGWGGNTYDYDYEGNITSMSNYGNLSYTDFRATQIQNYSADGVSTNKRTLKFFRSIERPSFINENGKRVTFVYDGNYQRIWMEQYSVPDTVTVPLVPPAETRYYLSDNYEISDGGLLKKRYYYYVGGDAYDAKAVMYITRDTCRLYQMYRDNVGSIALYASRQDNFRLYYNPWGVRTKGQNGQQYSPGSVHGPKFIRSYTGHEELPWFGLLNANARLYDPYMGRFLSPDPLLAISGDPLDFNPYVYARNNPCRYVDRNGEIWWLVGAAILGGAFNVMANFDDINGTGDFFKYFGVGAIAGAAGAAAVVYAPAAIGGFAGGAISGAIGGASSGFVLGGGNALSSGESFWSSAFSGMWQGGLSGAVLGGITGGIWAKIQGNNFWNGNPRTKITYHRPAMSEPDAIPSQPSFSDNTPTIQSQKPLQNHHYATNKNSKYTPKMENIVRKYDLDLNGEWNIEKLPHQGRHPNEYHKFVYQQMKTIDMMPDMNQGRFINQFEQRVKAPIRNNPEMLYKKFWQQMIR